MNNTRKIKKNTNFLIDENHVYIPWNFNLEFHLISSNFNYIL